MERGIRPWSERHIEIDVSIACVSSLGSSNEYKLTLGSVSQVVLKQYKDLQGAHFHGMVDTLGNHLDQAPSLQKFIVGSAIRTVSYSM
jgi:hypothetical protein